MSEISKERAQEIFLGNGPEPTVQEERALARIALDWLALREILDGVPQEAIDGGWTARGLSDYAKQLETELAALRERAEPVGFVGRNKETGKFASWLYPEAPWLTDDKYEVLSAYITPPAPVAAGWIACSERMPEREYVLAADFSGAYYLPSLPNTQVGIYADWFEDGKPSWDDGDGNDLHLKQVTHWMPLPEAPGKEE